MKNLGFLLLLLLAGTRILWAQAPGPRPRIGLTLSGGGVRGLAHIGLLEALDSAGVRVDYVTGTSMGAIVGALYAAGYRGTDIERAAREVDWSTLLTNAAQLRTVTMAEKDDAGRFLVELPFVKGAFELPNGVIESEELWLKLSELFFPYYQTKDFSRFQRSFQCVATDVLSGEAVVLREGEVAQAVRASMAIPFIFTPVTMQGHRLIDGGLVRNFPVSEAKALGADLVIGSNVSSGAYTDATLHSPLDVLLQVSSFRDNLDFKIERALCSVYVDYPLGNYTAEGFANAGPITAIGLRRGRAMFPQLRRLADSLDALYGPAPRLPRPRRADSVYVSGCQMPGVEPQYLSLILHRMQFRDHRYYSPQQLTTAVRRAFGTRYFRRITYTLKPLPDSTAQVVFDVVRAPRTHLQLGLHYNSLTGIGLIGALTSKDFLMPFSTSQVAVSLGENTRARLKHFQYLTKSRQTFLRLLAQAEKIDVATYDARFERTGLYTQRYTTANLQIMKDLSRSAAVGLGTRYDHVDFHPQTASQLQFDGRMGLLNTYVLYEGDTFDAAVYPARGRKVEGEIGYVYGQRPRFQVLDNNAVIETEASARFSFRPYLRSWLKLEQYVPLTSRSTLLAQGQLGLNFNYRQVVVNDYVIGGLSSVLRNQITFAGLPEASLLTGSAATGLLGYRYELAPKLFVAAKVNVLYHDFLPRNARLQPAGTACGGALTLSYRSFLGPIDASLMNSNVSKKLLSYFNIGIPFGYR